MGLAIPGVIADFDAGRGVRGDRSRQRFEVLRGEATGADNGGNGCGLEGDDRVDNGHEGDEERPGRQASSWLVAMEENEDFAHSAGPAA